MQQTEESFLSDIIDLDTIQKKKINLIHAPCGSGKTTFALEKLPQQHCIPGRTLYLIDTVTGVEKLLQHEACQPYNSDFLDPNSYFEQPRRKITVMTYAKFGTLCLYSPYWYTYLHTIICDEIHKLPEMMQWETNDEIKAYEAAWDAIVGCIETDHSPTIIAMSATPRRFYNRIGAYLRLNKEKGKMEFYSPKVNQVVVNGRPKKYSPKQVEHYQNLTMLCDKLPLDKKGVMYIPRIEMAQRYAAILEKRGLRTSIIWSIHNATHPMSQEQLAVRDYIIREESIPPEIDVLIINKSCETCINIRSHVDYMVTHTSDNDTIRQATNRYRGNLDLIYIFRPTDKVEIDLPETMLNTPLYKEDVNAFVKKNNIRSKKGELIKSPTFFKIIASRGYIVTQGKISGGSRYHTVTLLQ